MSSIFKGTVDQAFQLLSHLKTMSGPANHSPHRQALADRILKTWKEESGKLATLPRDHKLFKEKREFSISSEELTVIGEGYLRFMNEGIVMQIVVHGALQREKILPNDVDIVSYLEIANCCDPLLKGWIERQLKKAPVEPIPASDLDPIPSSSPTGAKTSPRAAK